MKKLSLVALIALASAASSQAQTTTTSTLPTTSSSSASSSRFFGGDPFSGTLRGTRELIIGGSGTSDRRFSGSSGGVSGSLGWYLNDVDELVFRQSLNFSTGSAPLVNPPAGSGGAPIGTTPSVTSTTRREWNAATRIAYDHHFATVGQNFRPFVGVNFGGVYGRSVRDSWAAGLEAGGKFYVQPRTFIVAMAEYGWFFRQADKIGSTDRFKDGAWNYSVGVGFNF